MLKQVGLRYYLIGAAAVWTVAVAAFLGYEALDEEKRAEIFALTEARARAERDREWIASFSGPIYVSSADTTSRSIVRHGIEADSLLAPTGHRYYQLTPEGMALRLRGFPSAAAGEQARLVSRYPLNPFNAPDPWEDAALARVGPGGANVAELTEPGRGSGVRLMVPLDMNGVCVRCHATPDAPPATMWAGLSLTLPPGPYLAQVRQDLLHELIGYVGLWLLGLAGLFVAGRRLRSSLQERDHALMDQMKHEALFHEVWNQTFEGMRLINKEEIILSVNEAYCRMVRKSREELEGKHLAVVYAPEQGNRTSAELFERLQMGGPPRQDLLDLHMWDGRNMYVERSDIIMEVPGEGPRLLSVFRDLEERRKSQEALRESEERLRTLIESTDDIVAMQDTDGRFLYSHMASRYGVGAQTLLGKTPAEVLGEETAQPMMQHFREVIENGRPSVHKEVLPWHGESLWFEVTRYPVRDASENIQAVSLFARNITEQKVTEDQLRQAEDELRLDRLRMQIAADLHDDIGSTVSSTMIFGSILRQKLAHEPDAPLALMGRIEDNLRTIQDSLRDIVWSINPENDALENVLLRIQEYAAEVLEARGITLSVHRPAILEQANVPMQIRRSIVLIMKEAVNNVVKHAGCASAWLTIEVEGGILRMALRDDGRGFVTGQSRGYGLSTMRNRAHSVGGSLTVESAPGAGTEIHFSFPIA